MSRWMLVRIGLRALLVDVRRVLLTVITVALGAVVVLAGASALPAAHQQSAVKAKWLPAKGSASSVGTWAVWSTEYFRGMPIQVLRVADGPGPSLPPGMMSIPAPGTFVASPVVRRLWDHDAVFKSRYPASPVGVLPESSLEAPRTPRVVIGMTPQQVQARGGSLVSSFGGTQPDDLVPSTVRAGAPFMVLAFLVPLVWLFMVLATLGAGRRERRLAAMRLMGAPRSMLLRSVTVEAFLIALLGAGVGVLLFTVAAPLVAPTVPFGDGVWAGDVRPPWWSYLACLLALPAVLSGVVRQGARRALSDPLAATRRATTASHRRRGARAAGLLIAGATGAILCAAWPNRDAVDLRLALFVLGFVCTATGLVLSSDRLAQTVVAALLPRRRSIPTLLATRSVRFYGPRSGSVASSVALLVLLAGSLLSFFPLLSSATAIDDRTAASTLGPDTTIVSLTDRSQLDALRAAPEVAGILDVHVVSSDTSQDVIAGCTDFTIRTGGITTDGCTTAAATLSGIVAQRLRLPRLNMAGTTAASIWSPPKGTTTSHEAVVQKAAGVDLERFRNRLVAIAPTTTVLTLHEAADEASRTSRPFRLATIGVIALASAVALCSLLVALIAQLNERHRSTYFLRVTGASIRSLWASILIQVVVTVVPLVLLAALFSSGFAQAFLLLNGSSVDLPIHSIAGVVGLGILIAPLAGLLTYPTTRRLATTKPLTE